MTTNDHIAAIKEHLRAIEAEKQPKQPKKEPKRYLVIPVEDKYTGLVIHRLSMKAARSGKNYDRAFLDNMWRFIESGKIITVNEE